MTADEMLSGMEMPMGPVSREAAIELYLALQQRGLRPYLVEVEISRYLVFFGEAGA